MEALIGRTLGRYIIQAERGRGGMAVVFLAWDRILERPMALKVLHPQLTADPQLVERFLREALTTARLQHPHIVHIYDAGRENHWYYLAMEYLDGETLLERLRRTGPLPPPTCLEILRPLAEA
ncbi:MAG: protein kinase domain-containing protein, partial [Chloroflexia bacterium]